MARVLDRAVILDRLSRVPGTVGFYYKDLLTGEELCLNENEEYEAASVIKLPMFAAAAKLVSEGRASWEDKLLCKAEDRVPSCGVLRFFDDGIEVSLKTLCALMITISDNMATNIIMRHFGIDRLNAEFKAMGLEKTHIERLLFDSAAGAAGKQNKIVPKGENGFERIRREACPPNCRRLNRNTGCALTGKCTDCAPSAGRICNAFVTIEHPAGRPTELWLVDEDMGY